MLPACGMVAITVPREIQPIMRVLGRLKKHREISILVLAHTPKRDDSSALNINDLQGSKIMSNFADSVLAIGQCRTSTVARYIKHIKARSGSMLFDSTHLPAFILKKIGGNFLGFEFNCFGSEQEFLTDIRERRVGDDRPHQNPSTTTGTRSARSPTSSTARDPPFTGCYRCGGPHRSRPSR